MSDRSEVLEDRLEAARRRFEELKKKKSKKLEGSPGDSTGSSPSLPAATPPSAENEELAELRTTVTMQTETIKRLRNENTDLKLEKMDLTDRIADLEAEIKALKATAGAAPKAAVKPAPADTTFTNDYAKDTPQVPDKGDFRERLMVWKGWQVDMTQWSGPSATKVAL